MRNRRRRPVPLVSQVVHSAGEALEVQSAEFGVQSPDEIAAEAKRVVGKPFQPKPR